MCKPESLCCTVKIGTTLQINCSSIKKKKPSHSSSGTELASAGSVTLLHALWQPVGRGRGAWRLWVQIASLTLSVRCAFAGASGTCLVSSDSAQTEKGAPSALTWG